MTTARKVSRHRRHRTGGDLRRTIRLFRRFMGKPRVYVVGLLLLLFEAGTSVLEPLPIAYLIDYLQGAKPNLRELGAPALLDSERFETILLLTAAIVLIAAVNSAADSLTEVCMARGGRSLGYSIRIAMYSHLQRLPLAYHDKRRTGDVLTRVTGDVLVVEDFVVKSVSNILGSLLVLVGSFVFLLFQSWKVALVAVVVIPMLAVVSNHYSRLIKVASRTQRNREGELASTAQEMLTSIRLVQSYGRGSVDLERFSGQTAKSMHASLAAANIQARFSFVIALLEALSISAVIWLGVWLVDGNAITIGTLVLFVLLLQNMFKPARKIVSEWYKIGKVFASVERIEDLLDRAVVVEDLPDAVPAPPLEGRLTFRHVGFSYPVEHEDGSKGVSRSPVLHDIDFEVAPGEVVALVGFSGAGKSTIAQLVPRLYDADRGEVLVDGLPVRGLTLASLRAQVSVVLQETVLLSGTVAENIGYGIADARQEDIEAAARMANAHDFIMAMPDGYSTHLGERGSTLSGGQRQRLAIARAFIRRAPILILDEPTTGLDRESAQSVIGALRDLMRGTTTIVISHDPGLIRCADRVLVISGGRIVEAGRHETLLESGGPYAALYARDVVLSGGTNGRVRSANQRMARGTDTDGNLLDRLRVRLPGLEEALDVDLMADRIRHLLLNRDAAIEGVSVGKLWLRADGTCSLRYRLQPPNRPADADELTVFGRVHPDPASPSESVAHLLDRLAEGRNGLPAAPLWRTSTAVVAEAGLALSRFPLDPDLPTLAAAMDPEFVRRLSLAGSPDAELTVTVVHHPREGACVLRYRFSEEPARSTGHPLRTLYGKVYRDGTGDVVDGFLRALAREQAGHGTRYPTRFPKPVAYGPAMRLLITEELAGEPLVPQLLKTVLAPGAGERPDDEDALHAAVRESGRALAVLHGSDLATAPVRSAADELAAVHREIEVVGGVWPDVAERVRRRREQLSGEVPEAPDLVLSHGDFTPSQVLLDGRTPAVVDFDTLCWADPALDLGRYLAHLDLLARKLGGPSVTTLVENLTNEFLGGYGEATARTASGAAAVDRIEFFKATTLMRTALNSCRQLKSYRLELAMSLLDDVHAGRG
jgi:ABC-type multidrug transport system fused ATPase/permease subunit/aminoglycoside phosphotransferase (APT) family kinase protein